MYFRTLSLSNVSSPPRNQVVFGPLEPAHGEIKKKLAEEKRAKSQQTVYIASDEFERPICKRQLF